MALRIRDIFRTILNLDSEKKEISVSGEPLRDTHVMMDMLCVEREGYMGEFLTPLFDTAQRTLKLYEQQQISPTLTEQQESNTAVLQQSSK